MAMMTLDELFDALDLGADGELSRTELHEAARELGWHWHEAPIYAVLDVLTIEVPLSRDGFVSSVAQILRDPRGPYGEVLRRAPRPWLAGGGSKRLSDRRGSTPQAAADRDSSEGLAELLERLLGASAADDYRSLLQHHTKPCATCSADDSALLLIDPQRSFTSGTWKRSVGRGADAEVEPVRLAFERCGELLSALSDRVETIFTRCPFPPDSYEWDERVADAIARDQIYFVKPGNSALWPLTNGFAEWLESLVERGKSKLVMGGCTLNSCVRLSAIETAERLCDRSFSVVVDLSLCGARSSNYARSRLFGGMSSVASAVREMVDAGVEVVEQTVWW